MRMILAETQRINEKNVDHIKVDFTTIRKFSKKYRLRNYYFDSNSTHFFEMSK